MTSTRDQIKAFVSRIERLDEEAAAISADKSEVYKEAKASGFDVPALKAVVAYRRKRDKLGPEKLVERDSVFATYLHAVEGSEPHAPARARENIEEFRPVSSVTPGSRDTNADAADPGSIKPGVTLETESREGEQVETPAAEAESAVSRMPMPTETAAASSIYPDDFPLEMRRIVEAT